MKLFIIALSFLISTIIPKGLYADGTQLHPNMYQIQVLIEKQWDKIMAARMDGKISPQQTKILIEALRQIRIKTRDYVIQGNLQDLTNSHVAAINLLLNSNDVSLSSQVNTLPTPIP